MVSHEKLFVSQKLFKTVPKKKVCNKRTLEMRIGGGRRFPETKNSEKAVGAVSHFRLDETLQRFSKAIN